MILDIVFNITICDALLNQLARVIHTPSRKANRQALCSALILSKKQK
ncbi:alpha/beta hydrolase [Brasilonema sp. UFV-L1]